MDETLDQTQPAGGLSATIDKSGKISPDGKVALDPTQTGELLANMQAMIDSRQGPMQSFNRGLERAAAWGSGGIQGPSAALAQLNQNQQAEDKSTFEMRQQMAAYKAAMERQRRGAETLGFGVQPAAQPGAQPGMPSAAQPAYMTMLNSLPASVRPAGMLALQNGDFDKFSELVSSHEIKRPDIQKNLEFSKSLPPQEGDVFNRQVFEKSYQPQTYVDAEGRSFQYSLPNAMPPEMRGQQRPAGSTPAAGDALSQIQNSVYKTESSIGRADTSKPGVQGAVGPMQITQDTWNTNTARGVIPKNLDINNPRDNKLAGDKILAHYYNKFGGDVDKTLAAYHGGEGAINSDGTINTNRKDANGMTIGNYIAKNKADIVGALPVSKMRAELTSNIAAPVEPRMSVGERTAKEAGETARQTELGKLSATSEKEIKDAGRLAGSRQVTQDAIIGLLDDPELKNMVGKFKTGTKPAVIIQQMQDGINAGNFGSIGLNRLQENLAQEGQTPTAIRKFDQLKALVKQNELEWRKLYLKGEGSVSNMEGSTVQEAVGSVNDPIGKLKMISAVIRERALFDAEVYSGLKASGKGVNVSDFLDSTQYQTLNDKHNLRLANILNKDPSELKSNFAFKTPSSAEKSQNSSGNDDEYTKWKQSKGLK